MEIYAEIESSQRLSNLVGFNLRQSISKLVAEFPLFVRSKGINSKMLELQNRSLNRAEGDLVS